VEGRRFPNLFDGLYFVLYSSIHLRVLVDWTNGGSCKPSVTPMEKKVR
jgi:hypothetical protein